MNQFQLSILIAILFVSCHSEDQNILRLTDAQILEVKNQAILAKKLDDNRRDDQPTFDDSNGNRMFPYSLVGLTQRPQLIQTKQNGAVILNYRYDSVGRLQEAYLNYKLSEEAAYRQVYQYGQQGLQQISFYWGSMPGTPINLIRTLKFMTNHVGRINSYFESSSPAGGTTRQLRFDQRGQLIWSATVIGDPNTSTQVGEYSRAIRDVNNNVRTVRTLAGKFYTIDYEYDNKPNPLYELNAPDFTSPNNIIKEIKRNLSGEVVSVTEYTYEYRPDGYPIFRRSGTDVFEYVYAN
ncbi:hypothetical protein IC229_32175 [Spirosoma sp. BT702]|uniref:Uncharacterized protein n=1 Tax=Spirosoma profusum TaxID=2771354 RepID=A0A927AVQ9_9BACT|nr:hypothetical protein [Spirosoma profusum]MBD2705320.1 hypothetical protein [Spirosoma profusum]